MSSAAFLVSVAHITSVSMNRGARFRGDGDPYKTYGCSQVLAVAAICYQSFSTSPQLVILIGFLQDGQRNGNPSPQISGMIAWSGSAWSHWPGSWDLAETMEPLQYVQHPHQALQRFTRGSSPPEGTSRGALFRLCKLMDVLMQESLPRFPPSWSHYFANPFNKPCSFRSFSLIPLPHHLCPPHCIKFPEKLIQFWGCRSPPCWF